ncbi:MAG: DoxX family protein [Nocardioidaceae bacterium]
MKITVWIVSGMLALVFVAIGLTKLLTPATDLESMAEGVPVVLLRIAGAAEVLGAVGLILPAVTRILPILTPLAASGLVLTMTGATITNIVIGEYVLMVQPVVLGVLAGFVAWARFGGQAIRPRNVVQPATG